MAVALAISKQPTEKLHALKTIKSTIGFLAIGSQLIRTANAVERRWSGLWPPVLRVCPESSGRIAEFSEHEAD